MGSAIRDHSRVRACSPRVLLIEDDWNVRRALGRALASRYEIEAAPDGDYALRLLQREAFDAVVADYDMPGTNGIGVLRHVHRRDPGIVRVLMSGREIRELPDHVASGVVHAFLRKPISGRDVVDCLSRIFDAAHAE